MLFYHLKLPDLFSIVNVNETEMNTSDHALIYHYHIISGSFIPIKRNLKSLETSAVKLTKLRRDICLQALVLQFH